jgi:hypothetical protein
LLDERLRRLWVLQCDSFSTTLEHLIAPMPTTIDMDSDDLSAAKEIVR